MLVTHSGNALPRPLRIGLSACFFHADPQRAVFKGKTLLYLEESMAEWWMQAGVIPWLLPRAKGSIQVDDIVSEIDGLVLQGGSDVCPRTYGEEPLRPEWSGDEARDIYEIELLRRCVALNKPVFGICRGLQLINVAFGGTLYQDVETQVPSAFVHRNWTIYDQLFHDVHIEPHTRLAQLYPEFLQVRTNSVHHQAIKDVGRGLAVQARCGSDGMVEAIFGTDMPAYIMGVQWHPEFHDPNDATLVTGNPLRDDFLRAVLECKEQRQLHGEP